MPSAVSAAAEKNRRMAAAFTSFVLSLHHSIAHFVGAGVRQALDNVSDQVSTCLTPLLLEIRRASSTRCCGRGRSRFTLGRNLQFLADLDLVSFQIIRRAQR